MQNKKSVGIIGIGSSVPQKVLTNFDLEKMVDTSDEWISKRTGIKERRILDNDVPSYTLGLEAAKKAIVNSGKNVEDIDLIIVATETPDYLAPSMACIIQSRLGAKNAAAFDINAACSGFVYGMTVATQFVQTGYYKCVLVLGCEALSKITDWKDRNTCVLFADGAGAAIIAPVEEGYGVLSTYIGADGDLGKNITIPGCFNDEEENSKRINENKRTIWMDGGEVFKFAIKILEIATNNVLEKANLTLEDIKLLIPHQANIRIIEGAAKRLRISSERVFTNVHKYGNISSASVPVALDEAYKSGRIEKGDNIVLVGFGGGLTWGALALKWSK